MVTTLTSAPATRRQTLRVLVLGPDPDVAKPAEVAQGDLALGSMRYCLTR